MFEFFGQCMALAMRTQYLLNLNISPIIWKRITGDVVRWSDVSDFDVMAYELIEGNQDQSSQNRIKPLKEREIDWEEMKLRQQKCKDPNLHKIFSKFVQTKDIDDFIDQYRKHWTNKFIEECDAIRRGIITLIPLRTLGIFSWHEIRHKVCGAYEVNIPELKRIARYDSGYSAESKPVKVFWKVFEDMFSEQDRADFLTFVYGQNRLPDNMDILEYKFKISRRGTSGDVERALPISHTCYFQIELPEYPTADVCYRQLKIAIQCREIDLDGNASMSGVQTTVSDDESSDE